MSINWCNNDELTIKGDGAIACFIPANDGSDYDDYEPQPSFADIGVAMGRWNEKHPGDVSAYVVIAIGKLGSEGRNVSGVPVKTDYRTWISRNRQRRREGLSYQENMRLFFNANTPFRHISAIIVRGL